LERLRFFKLGPIFREKWGFVLVPRALVFNRDADFSPFAQIVCMGQFSRFKTRRGVFEPRVRITISGPRQEGGD
jgi:hypothetical protein